MRIPEAIKRLFTKDEVFTFVSHDQTEPTIVVYEPECKVDEIHSVNGYLLIPHPLARRLPEPHGNIQHAQGNVPCWKLSDLDQALADADLMHAMSESQDEKLAIVSEAWERSERAIGEAIVLAVGDAEKYGGKGN